MFYYLYCIILFSVVLEPTDVSTKDFYFFVYYGNINDLKFQYDYLCNL